ncbi:MAG: phosphoribosylamine--glycine ligase [Alphaproteobacteria bacterium]
MNILILGSGGREHAIAEAVSQGQHQVTIAPGNGGMAQFFICEPVDICDGQAVLALAKKIKADLVIIGPEAPLVGGIADILRQNNIAVFGPNQQAAMLEGSKIFAREFMAKAGVAQPSFTACDNLKQVKAAIEARHAPYIIKADGLAAGKGVIVTDDAGEAVTAAEKIFSGQFGDAGTRILVEDGICGQEISLFVLTDGKSYHILPTCQDHKRIFDGDKGPNTGGMGAVCPVSWVSDTLMEQMVTTIVEPTINGLKEQNIDFCGVIFIGVMVDEHNKPWVLEYNTRFGDPETEILLPALDEDWAEIFNKTAQGQLANYHFTAQPKAAATVILAAENYPETPVTGEALSPYKVNRNQRLYYAGVQNKNGQLISAGGRVLAATGLGSSLKIALENAYNLAHNQKFNNVQMRQDIGEKLMKKSPRIGIIMGSASDAPLLEKTVAILKDFDIGFDAMVASAHRTPEDVEKWVKAAPSKGIEVIIAAAGLSAALPGVVAAHSHLPIIGLPVQSGALNGLDALYSIAQMPPGVPVASVGINGAVNAALQAIRICAISDDTLQEKLEQYKQDAADKVRKSNQDISHWF